MRECYPHECCGVIVGKNISAAAMFQLNLISLEIHPEDLAMAESQGEILAYVHSHQMEQQEHQTRSDSD
ncbi:Mov34/MPN/PAD-1 family protein [Acinetobacter baumannii]